MKWLFMNRNYNIGFVLFSLSLGFFNPVHADVMGAWQLVGKLQVTVSVKGKSQSVKQANLGEISALFSNEGECSIIAEGTLIEGNWKASKRNFKTQLALQSGNALLKVIEKDLAAKSGLQVVMDVERLTLKGSELKNGKLIGSLKIKAKTQFLDYGYKSGLLTMTYDFIGIRIKADEGQILTTID